MWCVMIVLAMLVRMSEAGVPLPRKVVLNGDNNSKINSQKYMNVGTKY
jgi:hypothetical protein